MEIQRPEANVDTMRFCEWTEILASPDRIDVNMFCGSVEI